MHSLVIDVRVECVRLRLSNNNNKNSERTNVHTHARANIIDALHSSEPSVRSALLPADSGVYTVFLF